MKSVSHIIFFGFILLSFSVRAQEVGQINDPDGYTNIREGKDSNSKIIAKFVNEERFLYFPNTDDNWWKVIKSINK
jgi:hypothetical protein|tara:strand:- start:410 stop:637 length:228 start_codon:yes stop_codon:yes gene_type:complete